MFLPGRYSAVLRAGPYGAQGMLGLDLLPPQSSLLAVRQELDRLLLRCWLVHHESEMGRCLQYATCCTWCIAGVEGVGQPLHQTRPRACLRNA